MSMWTEVVKDVQKALRSPEGTAAIVAAVLSGNPATAAAAVIREAAAKSVAAQMQAKGLVPTPDAYAKRIQGDGAVKAVLRGAGMALGTQETTDFLAPIVAAVFKAEKNDLAKLVKGVG